VSDELTCLFAATRSGEFEAELHVYFDDGSLQEIVLRVHGTAGPERLPAPDEAP
jgi:hypothetical protein